jgi:hypothetical protein
LTSPIAYSHAQARHAQRVVDGDRFARVEADGCEAEIFGPGTSPDRHQDLVGFDQLAVAEIDLHTRTDAADDARPDRDPHVYTALDHRLEHLLTRERHLARQQALASLDQRDPRAERAVGLSHLDPYRSAAEHDQAGEILCAVMTSRLVHGLASTSPAIASMAAPPPTAIVTASRASHSSSPTRTRRSPARRPWPRIGVTPRSSSQGIAHANCRLDAPPARPLAESRQAPGQRRSATAREI